MNGPGPARAVERSRRDPGDAGAADAGLSRGLCEERMGQMGRGDPGRRSHPEVSSRAAAFALCLGLFALAGRRRARSRRRAIASRRCPIPPTPTASCSINGSRTASPRPRSWWCAAAARPCSPRAMAPIRMKPTLIASLSKAITGACVATLVRDGKLTFTTPLRDAMPQFFKQYGAPVDERLYQATVEELLAHRAGLRGNADDDSIYGIFAKRASGGHGWQAAPKIGAQRISSEGPAGPPSGRALLLQQHRLRNPVRRSSRSRPASPTRTIAAKRCSASSASPCRSCIPIGGCSRAWAAGSFPGRTIWPSSTSSILPIRFSATPSKPGSTRRRNAGRRPTRTAGTALASTPGPAPAAGRFRMAGSCTCAAGTSRAADRRLRRQPRVPRRRRHRGVHCAGMDAGRRSVAERIAEGDRRNPQAGEDAAVGRV